jgi:uncharacterized SAM-binding protein YcdF (DUF218 family)
MMNLATTSPADPPRDANRLHLATGALLGTLVWLECIALGIPAMITGIPYSFIPVAALLGALLAITRARRLLWAAAAVFAAALAVIAATPVVRRPAQALVRSDPVSVRPLDAVVVLSSTVSSDGHLRGQALDRLLTGLSLVRAGNSGTLILSRVRLGGGGSQVTSDADQARVLALLDRPVRVLLVDSVHSTRDEAVRMRELARTLGIRNVAVVTSPLHTYRSCATFEKVGFVVTCVPSESRDVALPSLRRTTDRVRAFQLTLYEWAGLAKYRMRGWI